MCGLVDVVCGPVTVVVAVCGLILAELAAAAVAPRCKLCGNTCRIPRLSAAAPRLAQVALHFALALQPPRPRVSGPQLAAVARSPHPSLSAAVRVQT